MLSFTIGKNAISVFLDGDFFSIDNTHINYNVVRLILATEPEKRNLVELREMLSYKHVLTLLTEGYVTVTEEAVLYREQEVHNYMAQRMIELLEDGFDLRPWARFMDNVFRNPAEYARDELYEWMERAHMPITEDGHFIAFKKVRDDYTDCHTGRFDNSPGTILEMDRAGCDPVRDNHCSTGFHFCSAGYLPNFYGSRIVMVKINPKDVTSIPNDYGFTKGRCCRYEVIAELTKESAAYSKCWKQGLVSFEDPTEFPAEVLKNITLASPILDATNATSELSPEELLLIHGKVTDATEAEVVEALKGMFGHDEVRLRDRVKTKLWLATNEGSEDSRSAIEKLELANAKTVENVSSDRGARKAYLSALARMIRDDIIEKDHAEAKARACFAPSQHKLNPPGRFPPAPKLGEGVIAPNGAGIIMHHTASNASRIEEDMTDANKLTITNDLVFITTTDKSFGAMEIRQAIGRQGGAIRAAARDLGVSESTLRGWVKKIG